MKFHSLVLIGFAVATGASVNAADLPERVTYDAHVKPILRAHCFNCHNAGDAKGGLSLESYSALREGGGSGDIVEDDGDAEGSRLWQLVNHDDTPVMPRVGKRFPRMRWHWSGLGSRAEFSKTMARLRRRRNRTHWLACPPIPTDRWVPR